MYIHIGNRKIISDKKFIGIFNSESIEMSDENRWLKGAISKEIKSLAIDENSNIVTSEISSFTLNKRINFNSEVIWSRDNDKEL